MSKNFEFTCHHVGIFVSDLDASIKWYDEVLGFKMAKRNIAHLPTGDQDMCFLTNGKMYIELYDKKELAPFSMANYQGELGTKHICLEFADEDYEELKAHLVAHNVNIIVDTCHPEVICGKPGGNRVLYIEDPDHILIEFTDVFRPETY